MALSRHCAYASSQPSPRSVSLFSSSVKAARSPSEREEKLERKGKDET